MESGTMIASAIAGVVVVYVILAYNRLVARRNHMLEAWSGTDVQLKRRHDLLPKLPAATLRLDAYTGPAGARHGARASMAGARLTLQPPRAWRPRKG